MQYEYHIDYIHVSHTSPEEIKKKMNEYGERGWEIFTVLFLGRQVNFPYQLIMRRPLPASAGTEVGVPSGAEPEREAADADDQAQENAALGEDTVKSEAQASSSL